MPPPAGPTGADDDNDPKRRSSHVNDDDDDDDAAPAFVFPGKNRDSTPVAFTLHLDSASFAPELIKLSMLSFKVIKLRQIIEARPTTGAPKLCDDWRPTTIVPGVLCPLLKDWLYRCTWIPKISVPPLIESVKNGR